MYGDCDTCLNLNSDICDECIYYERDLYDHYEPATEEQLKNREAEARKKAEDTLPYITLPIRKPLPQKFIETFEALKPFNGYKTLNYKLIPIYAGLNYLSTSNTHLIAKIFCLVPEELHDKNIIRIEENEVRVYDGKLPFAQKEENYMFKDYKISFNQVGKHTINRPGYEHIMFLKLPQVAIWVNDEYINMAQEILVGDLTLYYRGKHDAITLEGDNGFVIILPLKQMENEKMVAAL